MKIQKLTNKANYLLLVGIITSLFLVRPVSATTTETFRVSVTNAGLDALGSSEYPAVSEDGRYIAFDSTAENLVADDTNGVSDIFVRDTVNGTTTRVSLATDESQGNGNSITPSISADGRYIAFVSEASNLANGDGPAKDIFVRDTQTGTTICITACLLNPGMFNVSYDPAISANGRYVAFLSYHPFVGTDVNISNDIYRYDIQTSTYQRVTVGVNGEDTIGGSEPSISADGNLVAFTSPAKNLIVGDGNFVDDIFVRNMSTGVTTLISVNSDEQQSNAYSTNPVISGDGRYIAFMSYATNLVANDTNALRDIFVRDLQNGTTTRVSISSTGVESNGISDVPAISKDGKYIAFASEGNNLVENDQNLSPDIFLRNLDNNTTIRVSVTSEGIEANHTSYTPALSADGRFVAFQTTAHNLSTDDLNGETDIYARQIFTFADVPTSYWSAEWIERLYNAGITGGCSQTPFNYCPESTVTRAQMAVFLEKGMHGFSFTPANVSPSFTDTENHWAEDWIEALKSDGVTSGCGEGIFCPENSVTRAQMAVFLLKAKHGSSFSPQPATGTFTDVPTDYWAAAWIEQLAREGITSGCGNNNYCPDNPVTRGQMAVFLVKAFGLP